MTVRYQVYLGGRLLKVTERTHVPDYPVAAAEPGDSDGNARNYIDGQHTWRVDERDVAEDVALAMLEKGGEQP